MVSGLECGYLILLGWYCSVHPAQVHGPGPDIYDERIGKDIQAIGDGKWLGCYHDVIKYTLCYSKQILLIIYAGQGRGTDHTSYDQIFCFLFFCGKTNQFLQQFL